MCVYAPFNMIIAAPRLLLYFNMICATRSFIFMSACAGRTQLCVRVVQEWFIYIQIIDACALSSSSSSSWWRTLFHLYLCTYMRGYLYFYWGERRRVCLWKDNKIIVRLWFICGSIFFILFIVPRTKLWTNFSILWLKAVTCHLRMSIVKIS